MKYLKFIIILAVLITGITSCNNNDQPEDDNQQIPDTYDYASGSLGYPVLLKGVGIEVEQAGILAIEDASNPDYVNVILTLTVTNESEDVVVPPGMTLVDNHNNIYVSWKEPLPYEDQLTPMPINVDSGGSASGNLVYIIPKAATQDNLRLRWNSDLQLARIDVYLGPLGQRAMP